MNISPEFVVELNPKQLIFNNFKTKNKLQIMCKWCCVQKRYAIIFYQNFNLREIPVYLV